MNEEFLTGLGVTAEAAGSILAEHERHSKSFQSRIDLLNGEISNYRTATANHDKVKAKLTETEAKLKGYVQAEAKQKFHAKLKSQNVREDRLEAFAMFLGDDDSDEAIEKLKATYPEWTVPVAEEEPSEEPAGKAAPDAKPVPKFLNPGNPKAEPEAGKGNDWRANLANNYKNLTN
ncbi:MAG: hypothetical protein FWF59_02545 [Turicibacter sp.]|nr:hypothetical protein [Turicibacter sp.]